MIKEYIVNTDNYMPTLTPPCKKPLSSKKKLQNQLFQWLKKGNLMPFNLYMDI